MNRTSAPAVPVGAGTSADTVLRRLSDAEIGRLEGVARRVRARAVKMAHEGRTPHIASALSCVDILVALYFSAMRVDAARASDPFRDRFVLSKGHACMAQYATLCEAGFFPESILLEYARDDGRLAEHPGPGCVPGIEAATGSLGHGLSLGAGFALAAAMDSSPSRAFVLLSDAECQEGSVWEAAWFASANGLGALTAIIDYNGLSAMQGTRASLEPLADKWRAFGWQTVEIDGHDLESLTRELHSAPHRAKSPKAIVAHTTKGKGVSFMENNLEWHYRPPSSEDLAKALTELRMEAELR